MNEIPKDELCYWNLVQFTGSEDGSVIVGIVHDTELDHDNPDFKAMALSEIKWQNL